MRDGFDWLDHDAAGEPICNYCKAKLLYRDEYDKDKTRIYQSCECRGELLMKDTIDNETGLTAHEDEIMNQTVELFEKFKILPQQHPNDLDEVALAIHIIQGIIATRIARRHYPTTWPIKGEATDDI